MIFTPRATIDFESKSACDLKKHGAWNYSQHPSTQILCLVYRLPYWEPGETEVWHPAMPTLGLEERREPLLETLWEWITEEEGLVEAHNAWFEFCIWQNILQKKFHWPIINYTQWRCSAAKAAAHALPRALEDVATILRLPVQKDMEGSKLMKRMTKPRKSRKKEREQWAWTNTKPPKYLWHESIPELDRLIDYCRTDVLAEEGVSHALPDLNFREQEIFTLDLELNHRGFQVDKQAVTTALRLISKEQKLLNRELTKLTSGQVHKATQRARMLRWFESEGYPLPDTQKATIDGLLTSERLFPPHIHRALEIVRTLGRSSTAKYQAMKNWASKDSRVRGGLLYHGATTGRWTGKGVQPHNFPKGTIKKVNMDDLWDVVLTEHRPAIIDFYPNVMEVLSTGLRGAITATPGSQLFVADYAAIEARVLMWLADDQAALEMFRRGEDIYCDMASEIYNREITKADYMERQLGKATILGCGYQMGASKFVDTAASYGVIITDEFSEDVVAAYREKYHRVKQLWWDQEATAVRAVKYKHPTPCGPVTWVYEKPFLYCELPSGRRLAYPFSEVRKITTPWGAIKDSLTYMGVNTYSHKWQRQHSYGGMLVENITQACARDLMADAIVRVAEHGVYQTVLSVHDELVSEAPLGTGSVHEFEQLVSECPDWASGCPISTEGWKGFRYHK